MSGPRVSVIIPTYNRREQLAVAVQSVLAQTFADFEVIVVDDGSTDGSADLITGFGGERVQLVKLEHSGVPAVARNAGLARARGDLVAFLDSDDVWLPKKLERQIPMLDENPAVGVVCSNARVIDNNGDDVGHLYLRPELGSTGDVLEQLLDINFVIISSVVARRELVERVGGFCTDPRLTTVEDYDLWLRLSSCSAFGYVREPLLEYREHQGSARASVARTTYWASLLTSLDNLDQFLDADDPRRETLLRRRRAQLLVELALAQRSESGRAVAIRSLRDAVRLDAGAVATRLIPNRRTLRRAVREAFGKAPAAP